jgi:hypothetical protein
VLIADFSIVFLVVTVVLGGISSAFCLLVFAGFFASPDGRIKYASCTLLLPLIPAYLTRGMTITEHASSGKVFLCSAAAAVVRAGRGLRCERRAIETGPWSSLQPRVINSISISQEPPFQIGKKVLDFETLAAV